MEIPLAFLRRHKDRPPLFHGLDERDQLVWVGSLEEGGKTDLRCPYCNALLTAKKGEIVEHHFAHTIGKSECAAVRRRAPRFRVPLFDTFDWGLETSTIRAYFNWYAGHWAGSLIPSGADLVRYNDYMGRYEATNRGKVLTGNLSMRLFCQLQEPIIQEKFRDLERDAERGGEEEKTDLALYRATVDRLTTLPLVLSQAVDKGGAAVDGFYLIGTNKDVPHRVKVVPARAHLETYFYYRYRDDLKQLPGTRRTAFQFAGDGYADDYLPSVMRDLGRVPKTDAKK